MKHFAKLIIFVVTLFLVTTSYANYGTHLKTDIYNLSDPVVREAIKSWVVKNSCGKPNDVDLMLDLVKVHSRQKNLNPYLVMGLIRQESCFYTKARSHMNAQGYMQVIPKWHPEKIKGRSLYNPTVGIDVGTQVMREYINRYGEVKGLKVYSGGAKSYYNGVLKYKKSLQTYAEAYVKNKQFNYNLDNQYLAKNKDKLDAIGIIIAKSSNKKPTLIESLDITVMNQEDQLRTFFK